MGSDIGKYINTEPTKFQIAKDNKWEECWIIDLSAAVPSKETIQKYLNEGSYDYLAIEIQWDEPEGAYVFHLGYSDDMAIKEHAEFIAHLLDCAKNYDSFKTLVDRIDTEVIGRKFLFSDQLDFVRVSIFNYWFSSGPVDIWKSGEPRKLNKEKLEELFVDHQNIIKSDLNFQAMAFAYCYDYKDKEFGVRHIIHVPSAKKLDGQWVMDFDLMLKYLKELEGFDVS